VAVKFNTVESKHVDGKNLDELDFPIDAMEEEEPSSGAGDELPSRSDTNLCPLTVWK
jgi:hypothetical protein